MSKLLLNREVQHVGFIVADIPRAVTTWVELYGAGPFHLLEHMVLEDAESPFGPVVFDHSAAFGAWGAIAVELQQIHEVQPAELGQAFCAGAIRLNHVAYAVADREAESRRLVNRGLPELLHTRPDPVQSSFHHAPALGHIVEIQQETEFVRNFFDGLRAEAEGWDGHDPLRVIEQ